MGYSTRKGVKRERQEIRVKLREEGGKGHRLKKGSGRVYHQPANLVKGDGRDCECEVRRV